MINIKKLQEGLDLWDKAPFNTQHGIKEIMEAAKLALDMPAKTLFVAGLLSTIDFRPSKSHPVQMEFMAKQVIEMLLDPESLWYELSENKSVEEA